MKLFYVIENVLNFMSTKKILQNTSQCQKSLEEDTKVAS